MSHTSTTNLGEGGRQFWRKFYLPEPYHHRYGNTGAWDATPPQRWDSKLLWVCTSPDSSMSYKGLLLLPPPVSLSPLLTVIYILFYNPPPPQYANPGPTLIIHPLLQPESLLNKVKQKSGGRGVLLLSIMFS